MAIKKVGGHAVTTVLPDHNRAKAAGVTFPDAVTGNGGFGNGAPARGKATSKKKFIPAK